MSMVAALRAYGPGRRVLDLRSDPDELPGFELLRVEDRARPDTWPPGLVADAALVGEPARSEAFVHRRLLRGLPAHLAAGGIVVVGPKLAALLPQCGYTPLRTEPAFTVARAGPAPAADLAGRAYATPADGLLDLRWTPDEIDWLAPDPRRVWEEVLAPGPAAVAEAARAYNLTDPYGDVRGRPVLARHFGVRLPGPVFAAGVASLLRDLTALADGGPVLAARTCYADFPDWARRAGSEVHTLDDSAPPRDWIGEIERLRPALVLVDRPSLLGVVHPVAELRPVLAAADRLDTIVIIDESYAGYLGPGRSAVGLTRRARNLVVLRGLSKGYCQGGLRVGFAVSAEPLGRRVREAVPALQVSELSMRAALGILELGDPFGPLRRRLAQTRPAALACLRALGLSPITGDPALPWLIVPRGGHRLADHGILAKPVPGLPAMKVTVPLSADRHARLMSLTRPGRERAQL
jgi:histidinol-phosphate/aromatic aminotransferase/cobyric acid decarboxylase-like protein